MSVPPDPAWPFNSTYTEISPKSPRSLSLIVTRFLDLQVFSAWMTAWGLCRLGTHLNDRKGKPSGVTYEKTELRTDDLKFRRLYGEEPQRVLKCGYRICLMSLAGAVDFSQNLQYWGQGGGGALPQAHISTRASIHQKVLTQLWRNETEHFSYKIGNNFIWAQTMKVRLRLEHSIDPFKGMKENMILISGHSKKLPQKCRFRKSSMEAGILPKDSETTHSLSLLW